jgi:hypothetical protein
VATQKQIESVSTAGQKYKRRRSKDFYFPRDILFSKAFRQLTGTAIFVYMIFRTKMSMKPYEGSKSKRSGKDKYYCQNINEIQFTYKEALEKHGLTRPRFVRAIDWLIKVGLIDIIHQGSGLYKDVSLYGISDRWMKYGTDEFIVKNRAKRKVHWGFTKAKRKQSQHTRALPIQVTSTLPMDRGQNAFKS